MTDRFFHDPMGFEKELMKTAEQVFSQFGKTYRNYQVQSGHSFFEIDFIFEPLPHFANDRFLYIFEFKYSETPTLSDSRLFTQFARFDAFKRANQNFRIKQILVTNGYVHNPRIPTDIDIISEVRTSNEWRKKLIDWTSREMPRLPISRQW